MPFFHVAHGLLGQPRALSDCVFRKALSFAFFFQKLDGSFALSVAGLAKDTTPGCSINAWQCHFPVVMQMCESTGSQTNGLNNGKYSKSEGTSHG
jgi:hypothetical protein